MIDVKKECKNSHPRLFFDKQRIEGFRSRIDEDEVIRTQWVNLLEQADGLLKSRFVSEEYADKSDTQHGNYGAPSSQISGMGMTLGLAYQVTGDERYAEKLRDALLYYGGYNKWYGRGLLKRDPPWHSELNTARFCYGYGVGYDCIHDFLSTSERETIADAMVRLGILPTLNDWILPEQRIHALDSMGHNWWSVCVAQAGLAALSILGDELGAEEWVEAVSRAFPQWFAYKGNVLQNKSPNFDDKGAFYESFGYANYGLSEYLLFRLAYANTFGNCHVPDIPLLEKAGDFFLHTSYPTSPSFLTVNFGDSSLHGNCSATAILLLANGYEDPKLRWYLKRTDSEFSSPLGLLCYDADKEVSRPDDLGTSVIYPEIGWAIFRSSWEDDATLLAVKSGFTWNHTHADAGSFILFHNGKPLIIDSGNCSYGRKEYTGYYCQSQAHNIVLFNGQGQNAEDLHRGVKEPGRVHQLIEQDGLRYVYADATGPTARYFSRNYRHFLWMRNVILIIDDIRSHEEGKFQWLLHYEGQYEEEDGGILISNEDAKTFVRTIFPEYLTLTEEEGLADHNPDVKIPYLSFSTSEETREAKFITAILPIEEGLEKDIPKIEPLEGPEMIGVRLLEKGSITDVYLNLRADGRHMHVNSNNVICGWETDAYLMAIKRPEGSDKDNPNAVEQYFLACGSYLRREDKVIFDSLSKAYSAFTTRCSPYSPISPINQETI